MQRWISVASQTFFTLSLFSSLDRPAGHSFVPGADTTASVTLRLRLHTLEVSLALGFLRHRRLGAFESPRCQSPLDNTVWRVSTYPKPYSSHAVNGRFTPHHYLLARSRSPRPWVHATPALCVVEPSINNILNPSSPSRLVTAVATL